MQSPSRLLQTLSKSGVPQLCICWPHPQLSGRICKPFSHVGVCHGAKKEGPLGTPHWAARHQTWAAGCSGVLGGIFATGLVWQAIFSRPLLKPWQLWLVFSRRQDLSSSPWGCSRSSRVWPPCECVYTYMYILVCVYVWFTSSERPHSQGQVCSRQ